MNAYWDKSEVIAQGFHAYVGGVSFDNNPYRFTPLSRGGLFKAAYWEQGWMEAEDEDIHAIAEAE